MSSLGWGVGEDGWKWHRRPLAWEESKWRSVVFYCLIFWCRGG